MRKMTGKLALVMVLSVLAAAAVMRCAGEFRRDTVSPVSYDGAAAAFVLRDYNGYVSVFSVKDAREPVQVTDIRTETLRRSDRTLLEGGLTVGSRQTLLLLLEDLGA